MGVRPGPRRGAVVRVLILALDASTAVTSVAVARADGDDRRVLAEISVPSTKPSGGASEALLPAVHSALGLAGEELSSVERVLCGVGPGTFTGIRIAAATARALALGTGSDLARNSTLEALAAPALACRQDVLAVIDARRGEVFARRFSAEGPTTGIICAKPPDLAVAGGPLIVGDGAVRYRDELERLGSIPPDESPLNRVSAVGHVMAADLSPVAAEELVPAYVREPDAEVRRDLNPWGRP
jgi:tRNA threonylcarbamoyladenosine biosynthesis protein TsaB